MTGILYGLKVFGPTFSLKPRLKLLSFAGYLSGAFFTELFALYLIILTGTRYLVTGLIIILALVGTKVWICLMGRERMGGGAMYCNGTGTTSTDVFNFTGFTGIGGGAYSLNLTLSSEGNPCKKFSLLLGMGVVFSGCFSVVSGIEAVVGSGSRSLGSSLGMKFVAGIKPNPCGRPNGYGGSNMVATGAAACAVAIAIATFWLSEASCFGFGGGSAGVVLVTGWTANTGGAAANSGGVGANTGCL